MEVGQQYDFLGMKAEIKYIGPYHAKPGTWVGVQLDQPKGKNNGTVQGKQYFECPPKHGIFVQEEVFLQTVAKSKQQSAAKAKAIQKTEGTKLSKFSKPAESSPNIAALTKASIPESLLAEVAAIVAQNPNDIPKSPTPKEESSQSTETDSLQEKNMSTSLSASDVNEMKTPSPKKLTKTMSQVSLPKPQTIDPDALEQAVKNAEKKLITEKKDYDTLRTQYTTTKKQNQDKLRDFDRKLEESLLNLDIKHAMRLIKIEEDILNDLKQEEELQRASLSNTTKYVIDSLQSINAEHCDFEADLRSLAYKNTERLNGRINQKQILERKLARSAEMHEEREKAAKSIKERIETLTKELDSKMPAWQESKSLEINITQMKDFIAKHPQKQESLERQKIAARSVADDVAKIARPIFSVLIRTSRMAKKASLLMQIALKPSEKGNLESLMHFCDTASAASSSADDGSYNDLITELTKIEDTMDKAIIPEIDGDRLQSLLQSHTPLPLLLSLTPHVIRASGWSVPDANKRSDLFQLARSVKGTFHPHMLQRGREDGEALALEVRSELRKAAAGQQFKLDGLEQRIAAMQLSISPFQSPPYITEAPRREGKAKAAEDTETPELRRRLRDAEAIARQYRRQIAALKANVI